MRMFIVLVLVVCIPVFADAQSWIQLPPQTTRTYYDCWFDATNPEVGAVTGWYLQSWDLVPFVYTTTNGGATLTSSNVFRGGTFRSPEAIVFTDQNTGYVAGTGVLKTYDRGLNWLWSLDFGLASSRFYDMAFFSPMNGYVVGESWDRGRSSSPRTTGSTGPRSTSSSRRTP